MSKSVRLYRLFVASPGDCRRERELIKRLVSDWNIAYGYRSNVMLEAVLWETHAVPALGERPQELINRQVIDTCDLAIAIFKSRLGSPSGTHVSGTVEEIEGFRTRKQPTLVYFHEPPRRGTDSQPDQDGIRAYRAKLSENGLVWRYRGLLEFATLISRHMAATMALLVGTPSEPISNVLPAPVASPVEQATLGPLLIAVMEIRSRTTLLWEALTELAEDQTTLHAEIREVTFRRVQPSLDVLEAAGTCKYSVEKVYDMDWDAMPVFKLTLDHIQSDLWRLIAQAME